MFLAVIICPAFSCPIPHISSVLPCLVPFYPVPTTLFLSHILPLFISLHISLSLFSLPHTHTLTHSYTLSVSFSLSLSLSLTLSLRSNPRLARREAVSFFFPLSVRKFAGTDEDLLFGYSGGGMDGGGGDFGGEGNDNDDNENQSNCKYKY